ncbi:MAG: DNA primase [Gammaproteobacteria bacterium]
MAGRIPQQFIDDLISRIDIIDVIDTYVPLRKSGSNYVACCPFHDEKTPSFTVSQQKQFYHCFGCGAHGSAISFLMDYDHMDFVNAVHELANRAGVEVPVTEIKNQGESYNDLYQLLDQITSYYRQQLKTHAKADSAISYLKMRGLSGEIAAQYRIGFAPPGWDNLKKAFATDPAVQKKLVSDGMLIEKENGGCYDRFRDRIMFPIRDARGRVIGFGGRIIADGEPKYLNSPETVIFHKGRELYGLYEARKSQRKIERLLVVEGYMDVVMLAKHDIQYAVATLGTATTPDHLERMFRITPEIVFCFDGDEAGRKAAKRAMETALPMMKDGRQARFMFLPDGEDPDSLVQREGKSLFEERIVHAVALSTFFYEFLKNQVDMSSIDGRARLVELARPLLSNIPHGVFKLMMIERLADIAKTDKNALLNTFGSKKNVTKRGFNATINYQRPSMSLVRNGILLLLHNPGLANMAGNARRFEQLEMPGISLLIELLELLQQNPHLTTGAVVEHWRGTENERHLSKLAGQEYITPDAGAENEFQHVLARLEKRSADQRYAQLCSIPPGKLNRREKEEIKQLLSVVTLKNSKN